MNAVTIEPTLDGKSICTDTLGGGNTVKECGTRKAIIRSTVSYILIGLALAAVSMGGYRFWRYARFHTSTDNAYIAANVHPISSRLSGTVDRILVDEHQRVEKGATLVLLDASDLKLRLEQAKSELSHADAIAAQAEAQLRQSRFQLSQAEAKSSKTDAEQQKAKADLGRAESLTEGGRFSVISKQEFDAVKAAFEISVASAKAAEADLAAARAAIDSIAANQTAAMAQRRKAELAVDEANLQLSYTLIQAPVSGIIGRRNVEEGQRIQPGQPLFALVADEKWVTANFKETQLARMNVGQKVEIRIDAIPGRVFTGRIDSFAPASGAQFALLPPDNATGNFTKIVQRVPVKITLDVSSLAGFADRIVPGLSVDANVQTGCK